MTLGNFPPVEEESYPQLSARRLVEVSISLCCFSLLAPDYLSWPEGSSTTLQQHAIYRDLQSNRLSDRQYNLFRMFALPSYHKAPGLDSTYTTIIIQATLRLLVPCPELPTGIPSVNSAKIKPHRRQIPRGRA